MASPIPLFIDILTAALDMKAKGLATLALLDCATGKGTSRDRRASKMEGTGQSLHQNYLPREINNGLYINNRASFREDTFRKTAVPSCRHQKSNMKTMQCDLAKSDLLEFFKDANHDAGL